MIQNENIICFSSADWDTPFWTNKQHIMSRLSGKNRIFYIESLGLRKPMLRKRDIGRIIVRIRRFFSGVRKVNDNLYVFSPMVIPLHGNALVRYINGKILTFSLRYYLMKYGFTRPVVWTYIPNILELLGMFGEKYIVYHCVDEISQFPGVSEKIVEIEKQLLKRADIVFVTSTTLFESKKQFNNKTFYLPNVADTGHFSRALLDDLQMPVELETLPRPILGFVGAIDDYKVDAGLLRYLSERGYTVVLIGPLGLTDSGRDIAQVIKLKGIHYLGPKQYNLLPAYLKFMDVCLIPAIVNEYTRSVFPMKLYEYLAAGKPVVSTDLPSIREVSHCVYIAEGYADFKDKIETALREDSDIRRRQRLAIAKDNSWEVRINAMTDLIQRHIEK